MNRATREFDELSAAIDDIAVHTERYETYAADLILARAEQAALRLMSTGLRPRLDDMEAELSYLRVRAIRPDAVVQVGCHGGWSTAWLLRALRDNGHGVLHAFNLTDAPSEVIPADLAEGRWRLTVGDIRDHLGEIPQRIDYLFMDGEHSARFARWYLPNLVARLAPGTPVSVHDVFHHRVPRPFGEASLILKWLHRNHLRYFTASPARQPVVYRQLERVRCALGFHRDLHPVRRNPMIFFQAP